jgi:hypothetical protein
MMSTLSAPDFGRSLKGFGVSLIVNDLEHALAFATGVLHAKILLRTDTLKEEFDAVLAFAKACRDVGVERFPASWFCRS